MKFIFSILAMASQPPIQYNQILPSIPNVAGLSRPPLLQPSSSNGMGTPSTTSAFSMSSSSNLIPASNNAGNPQWARPPTGQVSTLSPISQLSSSSSGHQQNNSAIHGPSLTRPALQDLSSGRPPINPLSSGIITFLSKNSRSGLTFLLIVVVATLTSPVTI